jgi:hypothetical protein
VSALRSLPARPLVASADEDLLDELLRLLAAAGAEAEVATGGPALRRAHREAPLVLLGADVLASAPVRALPRRPGVVVVAPGEPPAPVWAAAVEQGAERVAVLPRTRAGWCPGWPRRCAAPSTVAASSSSAGAAGAPG